MKRVLEWVPALVIAVVVIAIMYIYFAPSTNGPEPSATPQCCATVIAVPPAFNPIRVNPFILETQGPYHVGQVISMKNGVCNTTNSDVAISVVLGVREETDPLRARNVVVLPAPGKTTEMLPVAPGCLPNSDVLTGPLPADVGPGMWRVYLILTARGGDSKMQMVTMQSDVFQVVP